jgi:RNA polymerase sigma-70 factor (ECF subfamily)
VDVTLLKAYRAGNREALARVYRQYAQIVRRYLSRRAGPAGDDLADVVQEVFIRAFSDGARAQYDGTREYGPFLRVIARNVFIDWVRRSRREIAAGSEVIETAMNALADEPDSSPGVGALAIEAAVEYVRTLGPELKSVYEQRFLGTKTQRQAAAALGISRQTLRTREQKLMAGLRRELQRAGVPLYRMGGLGDAGALPRREPEISR